MNLHIITGASKGLGAALADFFAAKGDDVVDISRTKSSSQAKIQNFAFDLSSTESKEILMKKILASYDLDKYEMITLTNNAGLIDPVMHIEDLNENEIVKNFAVNLTAPMALTSAFFKQTEKYAGLRLITNISSGVASDPIASWACYSAAKAGLKSFTIALAKDYVENDKVKIINFGPGVIDTKMQGRIREIQQDDFPDVEIFKTYKKENKLKTAEKVATALGTYILKNDFKNISQVTINDLIGS